MEIDEKMKIEDIEDDIYHTDDGIVSHDLRTEEIERNKHNFTELTSIRINFEPEEFKINTTQKESFIQASSLLFGHEFDMIKEFHYLEGLILHSGMVSADDWRKVLSVVAACIHLLSVTIVGAEVVI